MSRRRARRRGSSGGVSRRRLLGGLGVVLVGAGAASTLGTSAVSLVDDRRSSAVAAEEDPGALLGVTGAGDPSVTPTFTNNSASPMDVTLDSPDDVEFDVGDNGSWTTPPVVFSLAVGASEEVNVRFAGECTDAGTAAVEVDADLGDGQGGTVGAISMSRDVEISEAGQIQLTGSVSSAGSSGKYEFDLENTGCADVTFVGVGINETTTDADRVDGGGSLYDLDADDELVTDEIPVDSSDPTSDTRRDFNTPLDLAQGDAVTLEFDKFRRSGGGKPNVDMQGEDVRVTFYLSDGSSTTIELCIDGCDF